MPIRKINAHEAIEDGDYIQIVQHSTWGFWLTGGLLLGGFAGALITNNAAAIILIAAFCGVVVGSMGCRKEIRRIPKAHLVEIKHYSIGHVTVVLDDKRVRHQSRYSKPNSKNDKYE